MFYALAFRKGKCLKESEECDSFCKVFTDQTGIIAPYLLLILYNPQDSLFWF